jgi:SecD/SecF fusion protein
LSQGFRWRLILTLLALAGSAYVIATTEPRLGLDLRGGTQVVFEAQDTADVTVDQQVIERTVEVLRLRVDGLGVTEPTIQASGERRIIVELPGVTDPRQAVEIIGRTAQLTFHAVIAAPAPGTEPELGQGQTLISDEVGFPLIIGPTVITGEQVGNAIPFFEPQLGG